MRSDTYNVKIRISIYCLFFVILLYCCFPSIIVAKTVAVRDTSLTMIENDSIKFDLRTFYPTNLHPDLDRTRFLFSLISGPSDGTATIPPKFTYKPDNGFLGADTLIYEATHRDSSFLDTLMIRITVISINDWPVAFDDSVKTDENVPVTIMLKGEGAEGDSLFYIITDSTTNGDLSGSDSLGVLYSPYNHYIGADSFKFIISNGLINSDTATVWITVNFVNDPPKIISADSVSATEDSSFQYTARAIDPEDSTITFTYENYPGWLEVADDSLLSGTPREGDQDTSFRILASDGDLSDTLVVKLTVIPVNDPPRITSPGSVGAEEDIYFEYIAKAIDPEDSTIIFTYENYPGWLEVVDDSLLSGTPREGDQDTSFTVLASDGDLSDTLFVELTVIPVNDPPVITSPDSKIAIEDSSFQYIAKAMDPENSTITFSFENYPEWLTVQDSVISGTPREGDQDTSFTVLASDGELSDTLIVQLTVRAENDLPQAIDMHIIINEDESVDIELTGSDVDGDPLSFSIVTNPSHGMLSGTPPNIEYKPDNNYFGPDSFKYIVNDGVLDSKPATVRITVIPVPDLPIAIITALPDSGQVPLEVQFHGDASYDPDIDGEIIAYQWNFGDDSTSTDKNPKHIYKTAGQYNAELTVIDNDSLRGSASITIKVTKPTSEHLITEYYNFPNPFDPLSGTTIVYMLTQQSTVSINIYDVSGDLLAEIVNNGLKSWENEPGENEVLWTGRDFNGKVLAYGVYICEIIAKADNGKEERRYRKIAIFKE